MPVDWRLHVLEEKLTRETAAQFRIEVVGLYELEPLEQHEVIQLIMRDQVDFPVVLVDGVAACANDIEADAISRAVAVRLVEVS